MILVDSSIWIDHFRDRPIARVRAFRSRLDQDAGSVALTGVVRTEILRGATDSRVPALAAELAPYTLLNLIDDDFDAAARLYRTARAAGTTVRSVVDCLIAALCIRLDIALFHNDTDFDKLARVSDLRTIKVR